MRAKRKSLRAFLDEHKAEIDRIICEKCPNIRLPITNAERRLWVLNDEGLYTWALSEGVSV